MKTIRLIAVLATAIVLTSCAVAQPSGYAIENVTVIPMTTEQVLENHTVVVRGDRIIRVAPSDEAVIDDGMVRIDGSGKFLTPGFAEMHGHIPNIEGSRNVVDNVLYLYIANGVTTVRGMLGSPGQLDLKHAINAGELAGPTLYLAGPSFSGGSVDSPEAARAKVRAQFEEGWDLLKVHPGLSLAEYTAMAETAHELGMRFGGHVPADVGVEQAIALGQDSFDHVDGYAGAYKAEMDSRMAEGQGHMAIHEDIMNRLIDATLNMGAAMVPTMELWETILGVADIEAQKAYDELAYMPKGVVENWTNGQQRRVDGTNQAKAGAERDIRNEFLKRMHEAGVTMLFGTDAPQLFSVPGFSIFREFDHMTAAGMSNWEVLASGTSNVGRYFANEDRFGLVQVGHRADLLLLNSNPLENIHNIGDRSGVMVRGAWMPEAEIQEELARIKAEYASGD